MLAAAGAPARKPVIGWMSGRFGFLSANGDPSSFEPFHGSDD
jgi:hypothetical protein